MKTCAYCGKSLKGMSYLSQRKYCSRGCQWRAWYYRNHKKAKELKARNMRTYRKRDPEKYRQYSRERKRREREALFEMYGDQCALCGFSDKRALTLDHINGDGNKERRKYGERKIYRIALERYQPEKYRTLCMNCQFIERQRWFQEWRRQHRGF